MCSYKRKYTRLMTHQILLHSERLKIQSVSGNQGWLQTSHHK